jgi:diguanylate cyclase (GGDEF)-like protein/PAS domain S-box-containing protein
VLIAKDGTERPIADSGAPIRYGDDGEVNGVVLVFRDQSDEYRMLKALRDSEQLYSQLVGAAPVGIFQTDARGMVVFANDVLLNMAGVSRDDMSPERWAAAYHPDDREQVGKAWIESVRSLVPAEATTYRYVRPDGRQTWAQARAIPLLDDKGELNGYVGVVTDITTERQQLQKIERISRLYATLSQVNSAIAHTADRDSLYREICRVIVDAGGFSSAAITHVNWQTRKSWPVISSGTWEGDYKTLLPETDLDDPTWVTVSRMALLSGAQVTVNDMTTEERISPQLRAWALARAGIASSAVPLRTAGQIIGALGFASNEKGFFTAEIIRLIDDIGRDVSFALENIESAAQKQLAEAAVMRSEQNLNVTLRSIGDAVLVTDNEGQVTMMNPIAEELTGWSENDARGRPAGEVFHIINEETRHLVTSPIDMVLRDGKIVGLANHTVLIAKDGTERPIADSGAPIRYGDDGEVNGVVLVFRDQSDEHRMLKALRESEQHYSTLVKTAPVGVFHADLEGNTTYSNTTMLAIAGMDKPILSLQEWAATIHPQDRDHVARKWQEAVKTRSGITVAYRYLHADGNVIWSRTSLAPVFDDKQVFTGFIGAVVDITPEQNHLREIEMLSRLYETLSQVSAAIVRSPDEQSLYDAVCAIMVEKGGFARAGVTRPDWDRRKSILVSDASPGQLALDHGFIELDMDGLQSQNLTTLTLLSGIAETANDIRSDDRIGEIFQKLIGDVDARSASTVAFTCFGEVASVLTLTSSTKDFFTEDILRLIGQVARDISHALENIESEKKRKQAEAKLTYNEERLRMGLHVTNIGMYEIDFTTNRIRLDATSCQLMNLGSEAQEFEIAEFVKEAFPEEESQIILQLQRDLLNGKRDEYFADSPLPLPGGTVRWLRNQGAVTGERTADGRPIRFLGVISDITTTKELEERDEFAATVFENSGESIIVIDSGNKVVMVNRAFTRISGYSAAEILGVSARIFRTDRHHAAFYSGMKEELLRDGAWHGEIWRRRKTGEEYPTLMTISVIRDKKGGIAHFVVQEIDISAQKEFEQRISHLAYRDALTDLPNRTLLRDRVDQSIAVAHREGNTLALLFLDLDHFKNINDSLGHAVGDHLLKEIALRLTGSIRETDTVGRLGGDEFLLLLPDADADAAAHVALKLIEECVRPFAFESHSLTVTPSIGIALYPKDGSDFNELLKSADTAMYRAKDDGRNAYRFYTPEMNQAVFQRMVLESSLRRAIEKNEFVLHYQPKFSLQNDALVGVEALIRWHQPELGTISPAQFIPVAEESGLIEAIGTWVLEEACRQVKAWQDDGLPALRVAVNFSARQFASRNIAELVSATLKKTGVSGAQLEMEITESLLAQDMDYTLEVLHSLKKLGVHVAVDDFGTGYSSLSYLKRFPIDRLKIDQSFVRDLVTDPDDRAIATAIVTLGHSLDIRVIAEGVETVRQLEILREMGCDEAQGYYLGRPIPASEMAIALRRFAAMPSREA